MRHGDWVNCFAFNPSGELLASGSDDHLAVIWDIERGEKIRVIHGDWLSSHVSFSPCSRFLAITYPYSWSIFCMPCDDIVEEQLNRDRIVSIVFSPDDVSLAVGTWKRALLFNLVSQCVILVLPHSDMVNVLAFSPDGRYLASSDSRTIMIWSLRTGNVTSTITFPGQVSSATFSPDGRYLEVGCANGFLYICEWRTGHVIRKGLIAKWLDECKWFRRFPVQKIRDSTTTRVSVFSRKKRNHKKNNEGLSSMFVELITKNHTAWDLSCRGFLAIGYKDGRIEIIREGKVF